MADNLPDLSGSKIQDTYQRVLHTDGASIFDGTGSTILASTDLGSLQTMNNNTISEADWDYVESMDQHVHTEARATFAEITASGNISSSGNIYSDNFIVGNGGYIRPQTAGGQIIFSPYPHGSQELLMMKNDAFEVKMNSYNALNVKPTYAVFNYGHQDFDLRYDYQDATQGFSITNASHRIYMSGSLQVHNGAITASGDISSSGTISASIMHAVTGIFGTGTTTIGDSIHTTGHITASGDILGGDESSWFIGDTQVNKTLLNNVKRGFASDVDSADAGYDSDVARINKINADEIAVETIASGDIASSGDISSSGNIYFNTITGGTF